MICKTAISNSDLDKKFLGDWVINPYVGCRHGCLHCYCPAMPGVKFHNDGRSSQEWGKYAVPKEGLIEALEKQLRTFTPEKAKVTSFGDGWILMSYLTDPYTPPESKEKLTRACLERLLAAGHKVRVQTRSKLVQRDFDLFKAHPGQVIIGTSLPHLDDKLCRVLEPGASAPTLRMQRLADAAEQGIPTFVAIAPFYPFHNEEVLINVATKAQAAFNPQEIFCEVLNPKGDCFDRVVAGLNNAGSEDHRNLVPHMRSYTEQEWAKFTHRILSFGDKQIDRFVPWPDTGRAWAKHLAPEQADWLSQFVPR